jgi:hypothetical protein
MPMWRVLHDLCIAEGSGFTINKDEMNDAWSVLMRKGGIVSSDRVVGYVQLHMYAIGYRDERFQLLRAPPTSKEHDNTSENCCDSKELFLAAAWFIARFKMLENYTSFTKREAERFCVLPPHPIDTATLPEFDEVRQKTETYSIKSTSPKKCDDLVICSEMLTLLCGRLEKVSKEWIRCQYERAKLIEKHIELTPFESFLLKHPKRLEEHTNAMRAGLKAVEQMEMWRVFWNWCETVSSSCKKKETIKLTTHDDEIEEEVEGDEENEKLPSSPIVSKDIRKLRAAYRKALGEFAQPVLQRKGVVLHDF